MGLPPTPQPQASAPSPLFLGGGEHSLARKGLGESQFRRGAYTVVLFICTYFVTVPFCKCCQLLAELSGQFGGKPLSGPLQSTHYHLLPNFFSSGLIFWLDWSKSSNGTMAAVTFICRQFQAQHPRFCRGVDFMSYFKGC